MSKALLLVLAASLPFAAKAQYNGSAVEACRAYAKKEFSREIVLERDANLAMDRYTRKLGNQYIASILTGNGAVVLDGAPSVELSFICLLADEKRALFFNWLPRQDASALSQCSRSSKLRGNPRPCLEFLLQVAEQDLMQGYAYSFQEARERDVAAANENSTAAYRKAAEEWRQYLDAECARRRDQPPAGVQAGDAQLACIVDLTRRRALDMR